MTRKKRKKKTYMPCFVFTLETIKLTEEALKLLEQPLQRRDQQDARVAFATETMKQVQSKLARMKKSVGLICLTTFDYNEKVLLIQAIQLYICNLMFLPLNTRRVRELQQCRRIAAYFTAENAKAEREQQGRGEGDAST